MSERTIAPFGSWDSPVSSMDVASGDIKLSQPEIDGQDIYWLERRPAEGGRMVVVRFREGQTDDITPEGFSVRSRVHEYGGGAYRVYDGNVLFSNDTDNGVYSQAPGEVPTKIVAQEGLRFADFDRSASGTWMVCIREDHRDSKREARNSLVSVDLSTGTQRVLVQGADFYASPRFSPTGDSLAWICWSHPHMPWDETQLWVANVDRNTGISDARRIGGRAGESIIQPEWDSSNGLFFLSDRSDWWNVYSDHPWGIEPVTALEAEIGGPLWNFRSAWYGLDSQGHAVCIINAGDRQWLGVAEGPTADIKPIPLPYSSLSDLRIESRRAVLLASSPTAPTAVIEVDLESGIASEIHAADGGAIDREYISIPEVIDFPGAGGETSHGFYYPPCNPGFQSPAGEKPPLVVTCHGGPTSHTSTGFDLGVQFWTSRGFGILDVDYGGSTGYGRQYRERLTGRMGEADVDDCVGGAKFLAERGNVDPARLAIRGGSAGGYIVLAALTFRDVFAAGASYYGIGDLVGLMETTHKFESRYVEKLVGPYPERADLFHARSPVYFPERILSPVIVFQGLEDTIVPPDQAEGIVEAIRKQGIPYAYVTFAGEGHGFRRAESVRRSLEAELYFYGRVLNFQPAGDVEAVPVVNLD